MRISENGLNFIKLKEGCRLTAYQDSANIWTIGYGTIRYLGGDIVKEGDTITLIVAEGLLRNECNGIASRLRGLISVELTQNQIDALISFCYNLGVNAFATSSLRKVINSKQEVTEDLFTRWNKIHLDGKLVPVKGLTNRRKSEYTLWLTS